MAIVFVISVELEPYKLKEAIEWTQDINAHVESIGMQAPRALTPQFGDDLNRMVWTWEHDSLADHEQFMEKLNSDEGVQQRIQSMAGTFVGGTMRNQVFRDAL